jgi:5-keto-L-gluconate epimerase
MKLAVSIHTPEVPSVPPVALFCGSFEERLEKAKSLGYDGVELMVARPSELDPSDLRAGLASAGLEAAAISSGPIYLVERMSLLAESSEVRKQAAERLIGLVDLAGAVGAPLVTIGGFRGRLAWVMAGNPVRGETALTAFAEVLHTAAERASRLDVRLVIEPLNRYETDFLMTAADVLSFVERLNHPQLGLLLDTFHMNIEEAGIAACIRTAMHSNRLWHVHLGDSNRRAPGQGHFDFASLVNCLQSEGYQGYLSAELLPLPDADTAAALTIAHMRQWVPAN